MQYKPTKSLESATATAAFYRESLATKAAEGADVEKLGRVLEDLAKAEAMVHVLTTVDRLIVGSNEEGGDPEAIASAKDYVFSLLMQGADDRWSGRGNDLKRSAFEGVQEVARSLEYYS